MTTQAASRPRETNRDPDLELTQRAVDVADGSEPIGAVRLQALAASGLRALRHGDTARGAARFTRETARIVRGTSKLSAERKDWRFRDPTWRENPGYRRLMQFYLAWSAEVERVVEGADLNWRDAERAQFLATLITSTLAPTNTLPGNPEALKRLLETGGSSLKKGAANLIHDIRHNGGMPSTVNAGAFTVGKDLAATPGKVIHRDEICEVIQYAPSTPHVRARPVVMVAPQINKYYFMDLAPGRSFVEHAVAHGITFFAISWRNPGTTERAWNLDTYAAAVLRAIDVARDVTGSDDVNLLALCAGGILTTTVLSHLAAMEDERVHSASFGVTLLDFEVPAPIGMFDAPPVMSLARFRSRRAGVLDGRSLGSVFTWLRPNDLVWNYWVNNYLLGNDPPNFDILAWNADGTNLTEALHRQFLDIFSNNTLATPGALTVLGTPVDLGSINVDIYVTGASTDHLTPWRGCYQTTQLLPGESTFILSNAGHIASLINPPGNPKSHYLTGPVPDGSADLWLEGAEKQSGTWWEHWATWVLARSGEERKAPTRQGNRRHPVVEDAPGLYVRGLEPISA
ncbi:MAG TPA: alpha/beta fold hydrolase [Solirubrobacteraceae bacterium]|nr:alpha/beta fold hydrolase [Solirubrobacteraceae bacterium]